MTDLLLNAYQTTVLACGALASLLLIQLLIADVVGITSKHVPGTLVEASHDNLLFRVSRTVANANESIAVFILIVLFCVFSGADATYTGYLAWAYVISRVAYALCYYFNQQMLRSLCFGISLLLLLVMLIVGFVT